MEDLNNKKGHLQHSIGDEGRRKRENVEDLDLCNVVDFCADSSGLHNSYIDCDLSKDMNLNLSGNNNTQITCVRSSIDHEILDVENAKKIRLPIPETNNFSVLYLEKVCLAILHDCMSKHILRALGIVENNLCREEVEDDTFCILLEKSKSQPASLQEGCIETIQNNTNTKFQDFFQDGSATSAKASVKRSAGEKKRRKERKLKVTAKSLKEQGQYMAHILDLCDTKEQRPKFSSKLSFNPVSIAKKSLKELPLLENRNILKVMNGNCISGVEASGNLSNSTPEGDINGELLIATKVRGNGDELSLFSPSTCSVTGNNHKNHLSASSNDVALLNFHRGESRRFVKMKFIKVFEKQKKNSGNESNANKGLDRSNNSQASAYFVSEHRCDKVENQPKCNDKWIACFGPIERSPSFSANLYYEVHKEEIYDEDAMIDDSYIDSPPKRHKRSNCSYVQVTKSQHSSRINYSPSSLENEGIIEELPNRDDLEYDEVNKRSFANIVDASMYSDTDAVSVCNAPIEHSKNSTCPNDFDCRRMNSSAITDVCVNTSDIQRSKFQVIMTTPYFDATSSLDANNDALSLDGHVPKVMIMTSNEENKGASEWSNGNDSCGESKEGSTSSNDSHDNNRIRIESDNKQGRKMPARNSIQIEEEMGLQNSIKQEKVKLVDLSVIDSITNKMKAIVVDNTGNRSTGTSKAVVGSMLLSGKKGAKMTSSKNSRTKNTSKRISLSKGANPSKKKAANSEIAGQGGMSVLANVTNTAQKYFDEVEAGIHKSRKPTRKSSVCYSQKPEKQAAYKRNLLIHNTKLNSGYKHVKLSYKRRVNFEFDSGNTSQNPERMSKIKFVDSPCTEIHNTKTLVPILRSPTQPKDPMPEFDKEVVHLWNYVIEMEEKQGWDVSYDGVR